MLRTPSLAICRLCRRQHGLQEVGHGLYHAPPDCGYAAPSLRHRLRGLGPDGGATCPHDAAEPAAPAARNSEAERHGNA